MPTGFEVYNTVESDSHWQYLVMCSIGLHFLTPRLKKKIHSWMTDRYGDPSNRWSLRYTDLGVDFYFHSHKDFATFMLFYAKKG